MKRLSLRQAGRCESAKTPRCKCRCGGLLHGAARGGSPAFFEGLPNADPHFALPKGQRQKKPLPLFEETEV
jgi:hypothetical protein